MNTIILIIIFLLVLSVLVFAHELGHFYVARLFGVKAEEFGFGFPPRIFGIYKDLSGKWRRLRGNKDIKSLEGDLAPADTVYSFNALPLGGFVRIKGENGDGELEEDSFASKSVGKRSLILSAGVIMNIFLAILLLSFGFMIGLPQAVDSTTSSKAKVKDLSVAVIEISPDSPANLAGLEPGDRILQVNETQIAAVDELQAELAKLEGIESRLMVKRNNEILELSVVPEYMAEADLVGIGISIYPTALVSYPFFLAIWEGIKTSFSLFYLIIVSFFGFLARLITGSGVSGEVAGPIGIAVMTGEVASLGINYLLQFTALLSLNLALINILPFPALDGGRILFLIIEKFKGRPVKQNIEAWVHAIGFWLLIALVVFVSYKDVLNLFK